MANSRILIVYYSRSGTTRRVAKALSAALQCDIEEIVETKSRSGILGYLRSAIEARRQRPSTTLARTTVDPSLYDLIILGTPVWAWSVSSPVRAYMIANRTRFAAVAFFCTCGGSGSDSAFGQMRQLVGKAPLGCLFLTAGQLVKQRHEPRLRQFLQTLAGAEAGPSGPCQAKAENTSSTAFS
jgi:flavodoxin